MDFKSLNMNLNQKEIEKDFLFRTGQRTESSVQAQFTLVRSACSGPVMKSSRPGLPRPNHMGLAHTAVAPRRGQSGARARGVHARQPPWHNRRRAEAARMVTRWLSEERATTAV
jgi:hypothetical protein